MKQPVIIAGMHRSGTALISELLHHSGIFMGADQDENSESNFFRRLNEWIFAQAGASWDNPYNLQFINESFLNAITKALKNHLKSRSIKKYLGFDLKRQHNYEKFDFDWGWKDSLNTFTAENWNKIFPQAKIIIIYRNPVDVAASLQKQNIRLREERQKKLFTGFKLRRLEKRLTPDRIYEQSLRTLHLDEGFKLWEQYVLQAQKLENDPELNTYSLGYENLLENKTEEIEKLYNFLDFKLPDGMTRELTGKIESDRLYAFVKEKTLVEFYQTIRNRSLVAEMNYHNIG